MVGSYDGWPADGGPANFALLAEAIRHLLTETHEVVPKEESGNDLRSHYTGPDLPEAGNISGLRVSLSAEMVDFERDDQGRDGLDVIIAAALKLGIEQGYRIALQDSHLSLSVIGVKTLLASFTKIADEQEKRGDKRFASLNEASAILRTNHSDATSGP